jgi:hypothetical protein
VKWESSSAGLGLSLSRGYGHTDPMATSLRGISSTACREDLGAMIRRLALSPFGYFVRRPVQGQINRWLSCYVVSASGSPLA